MPKKVIHKYKVVNFVDVGDVLPFVKKEGLSPFIQVEEDKIEQGIKAFIKQIEQYSHYRFCYMGRDKEAGTLVFRFLHENSGLLEIEAEKPFSISGHFTSMDGAKKFADGLKKALKKSFPKNKVTDMLVESIKIEDGIDENMLTYSKWGLLHKITRKGVRVIIITLFIAVVLEILQHLSHERLSKALNIHSRFWSILLLVVLVLGLEWLMKKLDPLFGKLFS